jgi:hypothetical protein
MTGAVPLLLSDSSPPLVMATDHVAATLWISEMMRSQVTARLGIGQMAYNGTWRWTTPSGSVDLVLDPGRSTYVLFGTSRQCWDAMFLFDEDLVGMRAFDNKAGMFFSSVEELIQVLESYVERLVDFGQLFPHSQSSGTKEINCT